MKSTQNLALLGVFLLLGVVLFGASTSVSAIQSEASWVVLDLFLGIVFFVSYIVIASLSGPKNTVRRSYTKIFA
ncbi:hypothetical protein [Nitrosomonas supralitoralis]|uniref:Uncharacterized protein n=1 Tax=Nitrosomonas supralitoralis TaxID=2116706 RepID=A0A2P7NRC9_9PROT|nr:hypothetical protein [Nitrosomonas supralitoralis]PSJ16041.1 hypothetical protein C7H79_15680 [Nitrosomonas supralitoralis]